MAILNTRMTAQLNVGDWCWPYKMPRGTAAVQVTKIEGEILHLSDGSSMHSSHFRRASKGEVK